MGPILPTVCIQLLLSTRGLMDAPKELEPTLLHIPPYKDATDIDADLELLKIRKFLLLMAHIHRSTDYRAFKYSTLTHALYFS